LFQVCFYETFFFTVFCGLFYGFVHVVKFVSVLQSEKTKEDFEENKKIMSNLVESQYAELKQVEFEGGANA